jgi:hypothetical protein
MRFSLGCHATCNAFLVNSIVSGLISSFFFSLVFPLPGSFILFVNDVFGFGLTAYLEFVKCLHARDGTPHTEYFQSHTHSFYLFASRKCNELNGGVCLILRSFNTNIVFAVFVINVEVVVVRSCKKLLSVSAHCALKLVENTIVFIQVTKLKKEITLVSP